MFVNDEIVLVKARSSITGFQNVELVFKEQKVFPKT